MKRSTTVDAAKAQLIEAVTSMRTETLDAARRTGPVYAGVVRGVIACMDAELTRQQISSTIATAWAGGTPTEASKGIGARYIILARYQRKEYLDTEKSPRHAIDVNGTQYPSPLDALDGGESFNSVYDAWTRSVKRRQEPVLPPSSPIIAARRTVASMFVNVSREGTATRLKVEESPPAFAGVMLALLATTPAVQHIPKGLRDKLAQALKSVRRAA